MCVYMLDGLHCLHVCVSGGSLGVNLSAECVCVSVCLECMWTCVRLCVCV